MHTTPLPFLAVVRDRRQEHSHGITYIDGRVGQVQVQGVQSHVPFEVNALPLWDLGYRHDFCDGHAVGAGVVG